MTCQEFVALPQSKHLDIIADFGIRLSQRREDDYSITLYIIDNFFVEVYFHIKKFNITHLKVINSTQLPDAYYDNLDDEALCKVYLKQGTNGLLGENKDLLNSILMNN
jgi:hypothetical protein